jgi:hypothetical protein
MSSKGIHLISSFSFEAAEAAPVVKASFIYIAMRFAAWRFLIRR